MQHPHHRVAVEGSAQNIQQMFAYKLRTFYKLIWKMLRNSNCIEKQ